MSLANTKTALDHCHDTGMVRATLCVTCNRNEGKLRYAMKWMARKEHMVWVAPSQWLRNIADYWDHHKKNPSGVIHPTFDIKAGKQEPAKGAKK